MRLLSAAESAREAAEQLLATSDEYVFIGEGITDPKAAFGTTAGLKEKFPTRVFDSPVSENGVTGVCVGAALNGMRPINIHMRCDFLLYAMDQIINSAAKIWSMYGGQKSVPMVIKAFIGRGWGNGAQHTQNLETLFAHIPGLKVVVPSNARNAKGLLIAAARDPNPVLILEHRWIHHLTSDVPEEMYETPIGEPERHGDFKKYVVITWGAMVAEALRARSINERISVLDLQTIRPLNKEAIYAAVEDAWSVCVVTDSWETGLASIVARIVDKGGIICDILACPDFYPSSTPALTRQYYPNYQSILEWMGDRSQTDVKIEHHDIPDRDFVGPF